MSGFCAYVEYCYQIPVPVPSLVQRQFAKRDVRCDLIRDLSFRGRHQRDGHFWGMFVGYTSSHCKPFPCPTTPVCGFSQRVLGFPDQHFRIPRHNAANNSIRRPTDAPARGRKTFYERKSVGSFAVTHPQARSCGSLLHPWRQKYHGVGLPATKPSCHRTRQRCSSWSQ